MWEQHVQGEKKASNFSPKPKVRLWDEALELVADKFSKSKGDKFAALASARITNEDNYLIQKFTRAVMGTNNIDHCARL